MARRPRIDLAGIPQHVIQRGNNRQPCFKTTGDFLLYLKELTEAAQRFDCAIHAYLLMTNHVHLLVTPAIAGAVSRMMQALGRRYVAAYNLRHGRTGTLWEGRFKSGLVDNDRYLLTCYRYIELNPVRAGMVRTPEDYRWSSHAGNGDGAFDALLTPHAATWNSEWCLWLDKPHTAACSRKPFRRMISATSAPTCNNSARWEARSSGRASKPKPGAAHPSGRAEDHRGAEVGSGHLPRTDEGKST